MLWRLGRWRPCRSRASPSRGGSSRGRPVERRVRETAGLLRFEPWRARGRGRFSGGEKQRVGAAGALVGEPAIFLMDEPLGHLEAYLRVELRAEIRRLQERLVITTIYVTHDQGEAAAVADRIAVMSAGRLQQVGSFLDLLDRPLNRFVAEFIGEPPMVFLPVHRVTADSLAVKDVQIRLPEPLAAALRATDDCNLTLGVRPNDISIVTPAPERLNGEVVLVQPQGGHAIVGVETSAGPATVVVPSDVRPAAGTIVGLVFESEALHLFDSAARSLLHSRVESGGG